MIKTLRLLFMLVLDICLLRKGPQDMPYSNALLLVFGTIIYTVTTSTLIFELGTSAGLAVGMAIMVTLISVTYLLLKSVKKESRFVQTMTALFGTSVLIYLLLMLCLSVLILFSGMNSDIFVPILQMAMFAMAMWVLVIKANIFRQALTTPMAIGVLIAIGLEFLFYAVREVVLKLMQ